MCRFGLSVKTGTISKKPTSLLTNSLELANALSKRCNHLPEEHLTLLGNGTHKAAQYTPQFIDAFGDARRADTQTFWEVVREAPTTQQARNPTDQTTQETKLTT